MPESIDALVRRSTFEGLTFARHTQHGKELFIGPLFREKPGVEVELYAGFDTDTLGTFTQERLRPGSQLDAARSTPSSVHDGRKIRVAGLRTEGNSTTLNVPNEYAQIAPWESGSSRALPSPCWWRSWSCSRSRSRSCAPSRW